MAVVAIIAASPLGFGIKVSMLGGPVQIHILWCVPISDAKTNMFNVGNDEESKISTFRAVPRDNYEIIGLGYNGI